MVHTFSIDDYLSSYFYWLTQDSIMVVTAGSTLHLWHSDYPQHAYPIQKYELTNSLNQLLWLPLKCVNTNCNYKRHTMHLIIRCLLIDDDYLQSVGMNLRFTPLEIQYLSCFSFILNFITTTISILITYRAN